MIVRDEATGKVGQGSPCPGNLEEQLGGRASPALQPGCHTARRPYGGGCCVQCQPS